MLPRIDELLGQNLLIRRRQGGQGSAGSLEDGFSNPNTLCIVDPRLFPRQSRTFSVDLRRLNFDFPVSRTTDLAIYHSDHKEALEGTLVQLAYSVWQIRTGEVSCTDLQDMLSNLEAFVRRCYLAKGVAVRDRARPNHELWILRYFGFIERYYVRMYSQELQEEFFNNFP